jgi:tetratricopeptide (TPR) repeat protein
MRQIALFAAAAMLIHLGRPARAQELEPREQAHARSDEGLAAFNQGRYREAIALFDEAYALSPMPLLLFNSAQAHRLKGDCQEALELYHLYLREAASPPNRAIVEEHIVNMDACVRARTPPPAPTVVSQPTAVVALPMPPPRRPLVKRPWFWIALGGAATVVVTGVTLGVLYGTGTRNPVPSVPGTFHAN